MKVKEFTDIANRFSLADDEIEDVFIFADKLAEAGKNKKLPALCGCCMLRSTDHCPWPNESKIYEPGCCEYKQKDVVREK